MNFGKFTKLLINALIVYSNLSTRTGLASLSASCTTIYHTIANKFTELCIFSAWPQQLTTIFTIDLIRQTFFTNLAGLFRSTFAIYATKVLATEAPTFRLATRHILASFLTTQPISLIFFIKSTLTLSLANTFSGDSDEPRLAKTTRRTFTSPGLGEAMFIARSSTLFENFVCVAIISIIFREAHFISHADSIFSHESRLTEATLFTHSRTHTIFTDITLFCTRTSTIAVHFVFSALVILRYCEMSKLLELIFYMWFPNNTLTWTFLNGLAETVRCIPRISFSTFTSFKTSAATAIRFASLI